MLSKNIIFPSLATVLLINGQLVADENTQENSEATIDGHVSVRSREMDPKKRQRIQELRAKQKQDSEGQDPEQAQETLRKTANKLISSENQFMLAPRNLTQLKPTLAACTFPFNCHRLTGIAANNRTIEMEDGSHWEVASGDSYLLFNWRWDDSLVITPNYCWLSSHDYYITNKSNNTYVKANLFVGPLAFGPYSHWITDIDYFGGHIYLENQMVWCVNPSDNYVLSDWAVNDHVIFGQYDSWFTPYDHILINVNMDDHLRVRQY